MLENIRIVMVRTFHPGNIGSAARAMKTMGLSQLYLVSPKMFPSDEADTMAAGADDIVDHATVVESVYEAVKDCALVVATTARVRGHDLPALSPEIMAQKLNNVGEHKPVALVFGPERMGLFNDDLVHARYRVTIPANPAYSSLNIAAAVQTLCYEIYKHHNAHLLAIEGTETVNAELPSTVELEQFYKQLEGTLKETGFIIKNHPGKVMTKLRNVFTKAELSSHELNILRGAIASMQRLKK